MRSALTLAALVGLLGGCAAFQAAPTSAQCTSSKDDLAIAQLALTAAQATLSGLQASGVTGVAVTALQALVTTYDAEILALQSAVSANCAATTGMATPVVTASLALGR